MLFSFGMIGTLSFLLEDFLGTVLWKGYNPATSYVSQLIADGAPNVSLTRTLFYFYEICLIIFFCQSADSFVSLRQKSYEIPQPTEQELKWQSAHQLNGYTV